MRISTTKKIGTAVCTVALALTMSFSLVGCGGGSSSSDSGSSQTSEEKKDDSSEEKKDDSSEEKTEDSSEEKTDESGSSESGSSESGSSESGSSESSSSESSSSEKINVSSMSGYMGVSDKGETFYYAESTDGSNKGVMVVLDPSSGNYVSFVGDVSNPQPDYVEIKDITTGNTLTFQVTAADQDGNVVIDLGDQGKAVLAKCDISEVVDAIKKIDQYGNAVA